MFSDGGGHRRNRRTPLRKYLGMDFPQQFRVPSGFTPFYSTNEDGDNTAKAITPLIIQLTRDRPESNTAIAGSLFLSGRRLSKPKMLL